MRNARDAVVDELRDLDEPILLTTLAERLGYSYPGIYGACRDLVAQGRIRMEKEPHTGRVGPRRMLVARHGVAFPEPDPQVDLEALLSEDERRQKEQEQRARDMVAAYVDGRTLEEIGDVHGLTRERVRQIITRTDPTMQRLVMRRRGARARLLAFVNHGTLPVRRDCPTCGIGFEAPIHQTFCSPLHRDIHFALRFQVDEVRRQKQYEKVARWALEHPEKVTEYQLRHARRVLDGTVGEEQGHRLGTRYLIPGSLPYHWALKAGALGWPLFDRFHPDVQEQVRQALGQAAS